MPGATDALKKAIINATGSNILLYVGLVDDEGDEIFGGGVGFEYARVPMEWTVAVEENKIYMAETPVINVPGGDTVVAGWRCYDAATGGNDLGGKEISPVQVFGGQGTLILPPDETGWEYL